MIIQLTNASEDHKNNTILINTDLILSVYTNTKLNKDNIVETTTHIYCPPHGTWEVFETPEEIMDVIKGTDNGK